MSKLCLLALLATLLAGCGSSSKSSTSSAAGVNPNAPESLPPGDIPDTVAYVPYAIPGAGYTLSTPEGWSRSSAGGVVTFTDKLNRVAITAAPAAGPITVAAVKGKVVPRLAAQVKGFKLQSVGSVARQAGPAVRTAYLAYSAPDPVTGKFGVLAVERYDFAHRGRDVTLTLSAPNGSDNVDPWNRITNSLVFTR
ncbi:MAG TPA: hypothetical protein VFR49_11145 [Solirubrobacteraceae bacterium]|nr:hypothetical protein [Solirubrobacteraceae bacterium]